SRREHVVVAVCRAKSGGRGLGLGLGCDLGNGFGACRRRFRDGGFRGRGRGRGRRAAALRALFAFGVVGSDVVALRVVGVFAVELAVLGRDLSTFGGLL